MTTPRLYQAIELSEGNTISLTADAAHHVSRVLRMSVGDTVIIFNGQGGEYHGTVTDISKKSVIVQLQQFNDSNTESPLHIHLGQSIARGEKMDLILQKSVELGVTEITPLFSEFGNVKLPTDRLRKRLQHWRGVIISACEQCGRTFIPTLNPPIKTQLWLEGLSADVLGLVLNPRGEHSIKTLPADTKNIALLIGPEGGLSDAEVMLAKEKGFLDSRLGPRVLRTETAALATIAALQSQLGDFN
ncbi:MAG: 16S rRNA (uracil(1498)-N(3))-methyltransferase [Legionellales bacterium]|nr:16S rRNA (uracil(1498)-N(3))-methyltransferase [Legionellales bacterium]